MVVVDAALDRMDSDLKTKVGCHSYHLYLLLNDTADSWRIVLWPLLVPFVHMLLIPPIAKLPAYNNTCY